MTSPGDSAFVNFVTSENTRTDGVFTGHDLSHEGFLLHITRRLRSALQIGLRALVLHKNIMATRTLSFSMRRDFESWRLLRHSHQQHLYTVHLLVSVFSDFLINFCPSSLGTVFADDVTVEFIFSGDKFV